MASKFDRDVCEALNTIMPAAESAARHPLLPTERAEIVRLVREALVRPDVTTVEALKSKLTPTPSPSPPFREATRAPGLAEDAPSTSSTPARHDRTLEESVRRELPYRLEVGRRMLGRPLTREEGADLETALRERLAGAPTGGSLDFGEAVLAGRLGPVRSPGLAPRRPTRGAIVEDGLASGFTAATEGQLGRMPVVESREAFERLLVDFARTVPFGAKRLDGGNS